MRTNVDIDDDLMEQAMQTGGLPTKKATIEAALEEFVRRRRQKAAIRDLAGIGWEGNLDEMREERFGDWSK
ncbi:type II toxin-antitoxin system VapB family antitoxin [Rhizobium sp. BK376]|uniref:type II toxin-antitoxin system VapB family antitoxin n=1 Tax=Rhizobium sp. BK376 TaxID=2512149 RepID=UPI00104B2C30|nr:type II toxin-antitoxin system VapB family antitoxin [Rhizobium sp. BK376]TCR92807.1 Arc/MetJ family transcription regulator [Rhizobium sp. BK376]